MHNGTVRTIKNFIRPLLRAAHRFLCRQDQQGPRNSPRDHELCASEARGAIRKNPHFLDGSRGLPQKNARRRASKCGAHRARLRKRRLISYWSRTNRRKAVSFFFGRIVSVMTPLARCVVASPGPSLARRVGALFSQCGPAKKPRQRGFSCRWRKTRPVTSDTESESHDARFGVYPSIRISELSQSRSALCGLCGLG
jgi:hypothetical protein